MTRSFDHVAPASSLVTRPIEYGWTSARLPCGRRLQARMMRPEGSSRFEARDDRARQRPFFRVRAETDGHVATARIGGHVASIRKTADARVAAGAKVNRLAPRRLQRRRFRYVALCLDIPRDHRGKACREQHSHLYGLFLHFGCEGFIKPLSHRQQLSREPRSPPRRAGRRASCRAARGASPRSRREATPTRPESPVRRRSR